MKKRRLTNVILAGVAVIMFAGECGTATEVDRISDDVTESIDDVDRTSDSVTESINDTDQKDLEDFSLTIKEAQEYKKRISVDHSHDNVLYFCYDNVLYGYDDRLDSNDLGNSEIKQIVGADYGTVLINDSEGFWIRDSSIFLRFPDTIYANYRGGLKGACDIYYYKSDGTVYIVNDFNYVPQEIFKEEDVIQIESVYGSDVLALLKSDGSVVMYQDGEKFYTWGEVDVSDWSDIVCIDTWYTHDECAIIGLKSDGTVVGTGDNYPSEILTWRNIVDIQADYNGAVALKSDGTLISTNSDIQEETKNWKYIKMFCYSYRGDDVVAISEDGYLYGSIYDYNYKMETVYKFDGEKYIKYNLDESRLSEIAELHKDNKLLVSLDYYLPGSDGMDGAENQTAGVGEDSDTKKLSVNTELDGVKNEFVKVTGTVEIIDGADALRLPQTVEMRAFDPEKTEIQGKGDYLIFGDGNFREYVGTEITVRGKMVNGTSGDYFLLETQIEAIEGETVMKGKALAEQSAEEYDQVKEAIRTYQQFLGESTIEWGGERYASDQFSFALVDVNRDGVPELFLRIESRLAPHSAGSEAVYCYHNGKILAVGADDEITAYYPESGIVRIHHYGMGGSVFLYQILKDGEKREIGSGYGFDDPTYDADFFWEGEKVSTEEFVEHAKKTVGVQKEEVEDDAWCANTEANRNSMDSWAD